MGSASVIRNHANPPTTLTNTAKSTAKVQPNPVPTPAVKIGDSHPPRLPKVVMSPEIDPEYFAAMSLHVVQRTEEAAKLSPPAAPSCAIASVLFAVWVPEHSKPAEKATPSHTVALRPLRLP